jgi:site-specific DNA recombinase
MNAAVYVRVSTDQQAEKGYSIDTQLEACRKYALELGATDIEEFIDDGYSGEFIDRPELTRLREALVRKEIDVVIAYAPDRLARKMIHLLIISEEIVKAGAIRKFASVNFEATSEGELMYKFQGIVAEYEKEKIKERTMRGKRGKASKGLVISDAKPFGYLFDREKSTYIINETEAELVRMIFDFIVKEKMGTARICKEINARGIPSPRAKKAWIVSSIHRILTNTLYKGVIYSMKYQYEKIGLNKKKRTLRPDSEWIPIYVPAIIDEVTWQAAQKQLQENKDFAKRNLKRDYLLNGLVNCAKCSRAMVISHSGCQDHISYYACLSQKSSSYVYSGQEPCAARQVPTKVLDEYVFKYLMELCHNPDKIAEYIQAAPSKKDIQKHKTALDQIIKAEKELLQQKDTVLRWFRQKMLTESDVESQLKDIRGQLADIVQIKKTYEAELSAISPARSVVEIAATIKLNLHKDSFTIHEKRAALRAILDRVIVERVDNTRGRGSRPEINVQLKLK